jgi:hypothetical protein
MKLRTLIISVGLLALLSVAVYLRNRPAAAPVADTPVGQPVLASDVVTQAAGLVVSDQGKKVELTKGADGTWRVPGYYGIKADFEKVTQLVRDLNEAKVERLVTENPDRVARLEFKDSSVAVKDAAGKEIWRVTLGKAPESGNGKFIRFGAEPKAYYSGTRVWLDTDPKGWTDPLLPTAKNEDVSGITVQLADGSTVALSRPKKDAPWAAAVPPAGQVLNGDKVTSLLNAVTSLRFSDTVDQADPVVAAAAAHARTITLQTFGGRTITVTLGRKPEEKKLKPVVADASPIAKAADGKPDVKALVPEFDTIPAGPVVVSITSLPATEVDALMKLRAFEVDDTVFTGLPQARSDLFDPAPKGK